MRTNTRLSFVIADDDADDQQILREAIKETDLNIIHTSVFNGSQLLDLLLKKGAYVDDTTEPDAIILDLNMPVMDGLAALRDIRANPKLNHIPVYLLYARREDDYIRKCLELGVSGVFIKPQAFDELKKIFEEICQKCREAKRKVEHRQNT